LQGELVWPEEQLPLVLEQEWREQPSEQERAVVPRPQWVERLQRRHGILSLFGDAARLIRRLIGSPLVPAFLCRF
jgi:hypothetical protein